VAGGTQVKAAAVVDAGPLSVIVTLARLWVSESRAGREQASPDR
jgi:hypothetical protein